MPYYHIHTMNEVIDPQNMKMVTDIAPPTDGQQYIFNGTDWVLPSVPNNVEPKIIDITRFKMLFTPQERIAIKTSTDPIVQDLYEILQDPRLTEVDLNSTSIKESLAYLVSQNILTQARADEISNSV